MTVAAFAAFVIRTAFYVPALALGDPTSVGRSLGQSGPYWKSLTAVFVIVGGGGVVINLAVERLGLPWVIQSLVEGFVGAFGTIPTLAAVCFLYWRHVRPSV